MTHYTVVVFDDEENVDDLLEPYDENLEVDWYKRSMLSADDVARFTEHYLEKHPDQKGLSLEELYSLHGEDWHGSGEFWKFTPEGVESWSNYNPKSKYDYYTVVSNKLPKFVPFAFVTPDGEWHAKGKIGWWAATWDEMPDDEWAQIYLDAKKKYKKHCVLDCHI